MRPYLAQVAGPPTARSYLGGHIVVFPIGDATAQHAGEMVDELARDAAAAAFPGTAKAGTLHKVGDEKVALTMEAGELLSLQARRPGGDATVPELLRTSLPELDSVMARAGFERNGLVEAGRINVDEGDGQGGAEGVGGRI